jgi:hypothetical protein
MKQRLQLPSAATHGVVTGAERVKAALATSVTILAPCTAISEVSCVRAQIGPWLLCVRARNGPWPVATLCEGPKGQKGTGHCSEVSERSVSSL